MEEGRLLLYTWIGGLHRITGLLLVGFIACCIWARKALLLVGFSKIVSSIGGAFGVNIAVDCCARSTDFSVRSQRTVFFCPAIYSIISVARNEWKKVSSRVMAVSNGNGILQHLGLMTP
jgi:hypothetical protein